MKARPPALVHKPRVEPLSPYTLWLFVANLFLIGINIIFYLGVAQRFSKLFDSWGGQIRLQTQNVVDLSNFFDRFWHVSLFALTIIILSGTYYLFVFEKRDRVRKWILFFVAIGLFYSIIYGMIALWSPWGIFFLPLGV